MDDITDINHLNSLLRGERAAVEAYDQCLERLGVVDWYHPLNHARRSHEQRVKLLERRIAALGGTPVSSSGAWGKVARWVEAGAMMFGPSSALAVLEGGEEYGKDSYQRVLPLDVSVETRAFVAIELLPEQRRTLASVRELRERGATSA